MNVKNQFLLIEIINTSQVTSLYGLFCKCKNFKEITGIEKWDISKVTDFEWVF